MAAAQSQGASRVAELAGAEGCEFPETPNIPEADSVTMEQMVAAQGAIQSYMEKSNELLGCLDEIASDEDLPDEDRQIMVEGYNAEVENPGITGRTFGTFNALAFWRLQQQ